MPSSTSLSEPPRKRRSAEPVIEPKADAVPAKPIHDGALPAGLRLTASDRPGQAQPVPIRDIPRQPWAKLGVGVALAVLLLLGGWELWARSFGLRTADIGDSPQAWAELRAAVKPDSLVLVGDSRILFDTDLAWFERLTGVRPVQLAIPGTNGRILLQEMAYDPSYRGLLIVGMADTNYFRPDGAGLGGPWISDQQRNRKPSQLTGLWLDRWLQGRLAFLDGDERFSSLLRRIDHGWRAGVDSPYLDVWKISESFPGRQTFMWDRIEQPGYLRGQARAAWSNFEGPKLPPLIARRVIEHSKRAAEALRRHGGEVVFLRPPSAPPIRVNEEKRLPKRIGWDALLAGVPAKGIHIDDLPTAQGLYIPEWSHLSRTCARVFTDAYVRRLVQLTPRLRLRADAPPPLTAADCLRDAPANR